jgi:preprotein translocase subunit SecA
VFFPGERLYEVRRAQRHAATRPRSNRGGTRDSSDCDSNSRPDPQHIQRVVEGEHFDVRRLLHEYSGVIEAQRQAVQKHRQDVLSGAIQCSSELERLVSLTTIDELWSEHLATLAELRDDIVWVTWSGGNPYFVYLKSAVKLFGRLEGRISGEVCGT